MQVRIFYVLFVCFVSVLIFGCVPAEQQKKAAAAQAAQQAQQAAIDKMHDLGRQMQNVQKEMADASAREPGKALEITARYMPKLTSIDAEVANLPPAQRDEFARTYRKN